MRATALGIRFAFELCVLASLAASAAHLAVPILGQALLGIVFCAAGAAVWAALQVAKRPENRGRTIVVIIPSSAERYLSTWLFEQITTESDDIQDLIAVPVPA